MFIPCIVIVLVIISITIKWANRCFKIVIISWVGSLVTSFYHFSTLARIIKCFHFCITEFPISISNIIPCFIWRFFLFS